MVQLKIIVVKYPKIYQIKEHKRKIIYRNDLILFRVVIEYLNIKYNNNQIRIYKVHKTEI